MLAMFTLLLVCQLVGEIIVVAFGLPLPGPVIGMALLFIVLVARGRMPLQLEAVSNQLLANLSLLFVPAGVGVMLHAQVLQTQFIAIAAALVISTLLTLLVTGWLMQALQRGERLDD